MKQMYPLLVSEIKRDTANAVIISFEVPDELKNIFQFEAGQYLTLETVINQKKVRRSYSICCTPKEGLKVGVKKVSNGLFSTYVNNELREKETILVAPPKGRFKYLNSSGGQNINAFAAGSGITPIISIIKTALKDHVDNKIFLV